MTPLLEGRDLSKAFSGVQALADVSVSVTPGRVLCLLGDNGAGKSTLIKILSGVQEPDRGQILFQGDPTRFRSPRQALDAGIATVYQDLAVIPLMPVVRNFFLAQEPMKGRGPLRRIDWRRAEQVASDELSRVGIRLKDARQAVGTLSGGERQSVAIARATYFGARVLILDEPTSALGVHEASRVLRHIADARERGVGVILITHNVAHAWVVGDEFAVLDRGRLVGRFRQGTISRSELQDLMAGGREIDQLAREVQPVKAGGQETA
jgi:simple sugar transport system ATP-binding protein